MDSIDETVWVDQRHWRERWKILGQLPGGGQGEAFKAARTTDGCVAFLKTIRAKGIPERRARFSREANAYDTFRLPGIPVLIESNAHRHRDSGSELYIATEFIEGPTLRQWRESSSGVDLATAVAVTHALLATLRSCHAQNCVHRDVKPDNLILTGGEPTRVALLDFGLSFHKAPGVDHRTELGQEIGNRFLRLPELSAGSYQKQDPRSDLAFAGGILFYLLTGDHPDVLLDAEGRLPHQRVQPVKVLREVTGERYHRLASLFDKTFAPLLSDRFTDAEAMLASMERVMANRDTTTSEEDNLRGILDVLGGEAERRRVLTRKLFRTALDEVDQASSAVSRLFNDSLSLWQSRGTLDHQVGKDNQFWHKAGINPSGAKEILSVSVEVRQSGDEIVIGLSGETVFRTSVLNPVYGDELSQAIRPWLLERLRNAL